MERDLTPYIFLDIDGVLAPNKMTKAPKSLWFNDTTYPFDPKCVKIFNRILEKTQAQIILSSDWRRVFEIEVLDEIFKFNKVVRGPIEITPVLFNRDLEIRGIVVNKRLSNFVIIDDSRLAGYKERFIRTDSDIGLQTEHVNRIVKLLT